MTTEEMSKWKSMLTCANEKIESKQVTADFLRNLLETAYDEKLKEGKPESIALIKSLDLIHDSCDVEKMKKSRTGKDLVINYFTYLMDSCNESQKPLFNDFFSEMSEWFNIQK